MPQPRFSSPLFILIALFYFLSLLAPLPGESLELSLNAGVGYDDNPLELEKSSGSSFAEVRLEGGRLYEFTSRPELSLSLQAFVVARFYDRFADTRQLGGELSGAWQFPATPGRLELFLAAADFDNPEVEDQDFSRLRLGGRFNWEFSPRFSILWENSLSWEDYDSDSEVTGPSPKMHSGWDSQDHDDGPGESQRPPHSGPGHPLHHNRGERSDRVIESALRGFFAVNPFFDTGVELFWQNRHSSLDAEKSSTWGGRLQGLWHLTERLELELALDAARTGYRYALHGEKRNEKNYGAELGLSYDFNRHWSWSGGWEWFRQDSRIDSDDYTRNQWYTSINFSY